MINMAETGFKKMQYKSEFNAGALDFERFDMILRKADDLRCQAVLMNKNSLLQYYAVTRTVYSSMIAPFLRQNKQTQRADDYREYFNVLFDKMMQWVEIRDKRKNYPIEIYQALELVHEDLLLLRQFMGIGIPMAKKFSDETLIRKALNVSKVVR